MRILTTQEFLDGRMPSKEDFRNAFAQFERDCVIPFIGNEVLGSFAYGSVNRDDFNLASDIDYIMIITDEEHKQKVRLATGKALDERGVLIQTRVIHEDHARRGFHGVDASFRQHLELSVGQYGYRGVNPLETLAMDGVPFGEALRRSISLYLMTLNNGYTNYPASEDDNVRFLKNIMEKPFHAMRVAIQYAHGSVAPKDHGTFHDTKEELLRIYANLGLDGELMGDIDHLRKTGKDYVKLLEDRKNGLVPDEELVPRYSVMLDRMMACYPSAFHFVSENARLMN